MAKISRAVLIRKIVVRYADIMELTTLRKIFLSTAREYYKTECSDSELLATALDIGAIDEATELA